MTTTTQRDATREESEPPITWSLRGRTYVPVPPTRTRGLGRLDEDRANSMTDEGGPPHPDRAADDEPGGPGTSMGRTPLDDSRAGSIVDALAAARTALGQGGDRHRAARPARGAIWHWDLASGRVDWDEGLKALFGYAEVVTDAAWRESRIHPEDRDRVKVSLQRATIVSHGAVWSDQYRFRRADGSYAAVTERAYVLHDDAGPRGVLGALAPTSARADG